MANRTYRTRPEMKARPWKVHPIWRGIGCLMLIIIPIMSYAGSVLLVEANKIHRWLPMPSDLMRNIRLPYLGVIKHLIANLLVTCVLMFIGFGVVMILYTIIYKISGPSSLSPVDAPPVHRIKRRKK